MSGAFRNGGKRADDERRKHRLGNAPKAQRAQPPCESSVTYRILNRLERLLFHRNRTGEAAWRHGPVAYVNLEIPEPTPSRQNPEARPNGKSGRFVNDCLMSLEGNASIAEKVSGSKDSRRIIFTQGARADPTFGIT